MVASIQQIIGKINPKLYAENGRELLKKYKSPENIPADEVKPKNDAEYNLIYDSTSETLEPVYFFILDLMKDFGLDTEKLVDNFSSSPGSGHFSELGGKASAMQQHASKLMADIGIVMRGVLRIIYDLKDFKIRLQHYSDVKSSNKQKGEAARLSLKQIWMDKVDVLKGNSSIKAMATGQMGFNTLIDAFMVANDEKAVNKLDLNDRVKRVLLPRVSEFNLWAKESEKELRKRYEIERAYLRSQVNNLKLYSRWAKPYLKAAFDLEGKDMGKEPALVKVFNTILLELTLFGKSKIKVKEAALSGDLPIDFQKLKMKREYYNCVFVDFNFRGIPQKVPQTQHYSFGGKAEVKFMAYSLNEEEIAKLEQELDKSDLEDVLALIEGSTEDSLRQVQDEINFFLEEGDEEEKSEGGSNPFKALMGGYEKGETKKEGKPKKEQITNIRKDDFIEREHLRKFASEQSKDTAFNLFDIYKKAHGMVSYT